MFKRIFPFLFLIPIITVFFSCGQNVEETKVKQFKLALFSEDKSFNKVFSGLVSRYNKIVGFRAVEFSETTEGANSEIRVVEGPQQQQPQVKSLGRVTWKESINL